MKLTNNEIYNYAVHMQEVFIEEPQKLPIKVNFYFQKNKNLLLELAKEIEQNRLDILNNYKLKNESNKIENAEEAQKELLELLNIEQEVQIYKVNIKDFPEDFSLTTSQMEALMFMIED